MKQRRIYNRLLAVVAPMLCAGFVACQKDSLCDMQGAQGAQEFTITVTDGGYAAAATEGTRITEEGYRTRFSAGDRCGLYIVRNNELIYNNIKLTATAGADGTLTWQPEAGVTLKGGLEGELYFLYYPYQEDMTGAVNVWGTDDLYFFAPLCAGWQPKADQSNYADYAASDLMTATGVATKSASGTITLSFSMTHRMALAIIEITNKVYKFTNTTGGAIPDYIIVGEADFTDSEAKPYCIAPGIYRYIVNAGGYTPTISGSFDGGRKDFSFRPTTTSAGHHKTYKIGGTTTVQHDLQVGDYFCKDGSGNWYIIPQEEKPGSECIGIVFHVGQHSNDQSDYTASGIGQKNCHGYVVALSDATTSPCIWGIWGNGGTALGCGPTDTDGNRLDNASNPDIDWSGYAWTQTIITAAGGKDNLNSTEESGYPATYYAVVAYENRTPAPTNSSGWFLPSIGQMAEMYQQRNLLGSVVGSSGLHNALDYWSSSEDYRMPDTAALIVSIYGRGKVDWWSKKAKNQIVRAVCAF